MKNQFTLSILLILMQSMFAQAPIPGWKSDYGDEQDYAQNKASGAAYDSEGNCYVAGTILNFLGQPKIQILKYDASGNVVAAYFDPGNSTTVGDIFCKILIDNSDHIYLLSSIYWSSTYGYDASIKQFDNSLELLNTQYYQNTSYLSNTFDRAMDMAFDETHENIFVLINEYDPSNFSDLDGKSQSTLYCLNIDDWYDYYFHRSGMISNENEVVKLNSISVSNGSVYLVGYEYNKLLADKYKILPLKLLPAYELYFGDNHVITDLVDIWYFNINKSANTGFETGNSIRSDNEGNIYIAGYFYKNATFGTDGFVIKLNESEDPSAYPLIKWTKIIRGYANQTDKALFLELSPEMKPIVSGYESVFSSGVVHKDLFIKQLNIVFGYQEWSKKFATSLFGTPFNEEPTEMLITDNHIYLSANVEHSTPVLLGYLLGYNFSGEQIISNQIGASSPFEGTQARALAYYPPFLELAVAGNNINYDSAPYGSNWFLKKYGIALKSETYISNVESIYSIYPNPTAEFITITSQQKNYTIEIFNLNGEKIRTAFSENESTTINLKDLSKGMYIIQVFNENFKEQKSVVLQ